MSGASAMTENLFLNATIAEIHEAYARRTLSPRDVAEKCIAQVKKFDHRFQAWVCFDEQHLLRQANETVKRIQEGGSLRPLEGIPVGIKDIYNTADFPTQMGSPLWKDFTPGNDARLVYYLRQAGSLVPGKTVTAEFAVHTLDRTLNPHDITLTPGTSSSGSAVAVALGMVPVAVGTQTAGSIVRPASFCGVYGCKPSFGLIPRTGMLKTTDSLDTIGFFTAKFADLERVFEAIRVHGPDYPYSYRAFRDQSRQQKPAGKPWRIVLAKTHTWEFAEDYAKKALLDWAKRLSEDREIEIIETELSGEMKTAHQVHAAIYDKTLSYYFKEEFKKRELVSPIMNEIIERGNRITVAQYQQALRDQEVLCRKMDSFLGQVDAIISLSTAGAAPLRHMVERPDPALMWTMTHLPVISAPIFVSPYGLPFGVQLVSRRYNDPLLFRCASYLRANGHIPDGVNPRGKVLG